ncbi:MAG: DMT family transporter [Rhodobacteraceae bacterium]|nr:DMT family transporter [Paracoccaceae bacterium]
MNSLKGTLFALLGYGAYSVHDVFVKLLGESYSSLQIMFFGVLFTFPLFSFLLIGVPTAGSLRPHHWWWTVTRTSSIILGSLCIFYAFSVLPLTQTYAILFSMPLVITMLAVPILGERVGIHRAAAVLVGLIGVMIVVQPGASELSWGHAAALAGVAFSSLGAVIVRRIGRDESNLVLLLMPLLASFVVLGLLLPLTYQPMPLKDLIGVAVLSLFGFIGLNCLLVAYKASAATAIAPMQYSQIIWATLFGIAIFNETVELHTFVGTSFIILSGIVIIIRESLEGNSSSKPVQRTRGRVAGTVLRIGPLLKARRRKGKGKTD